MAFPPSPALHGHASRKSYPRLCFPVLCLPSVSNKLLWPYTLLTEETAFPCYHRQPPYCQILSLTYLTSLLHLKWSIIPSFLKVFLPLVLLSCCSPITIALSHSPLPLPSLIRYWNRQESSVLSALFLTAKVLGNLICTLGSLMMTHECVSTAISLIGKIKNMGI